MVCRFGCQAFNKIKYKLRTTNGRRGEHSCMPRQSNKARQIANQKNRQPKNEDETDNGGHDGKKKKKRENSFVAHF